MIEKLLDRAFGGQDVAVAPGNKIDTFWPVGPASAGAQAVCLRFAKILLSSKRKKAPAEWVFLVGGAGNGKSYLANQLVNSFPENLSFVNDGLADRTYTYKQPGGRELFVVNDATIPSQGKADSQGELILDIDAALENVNSRDLFVCINRGVIIGELERCSKSEYAVVHGLLEWLESSGSIINTDQVDTYKLHSTDLTNKGRSDYVRGVKIYDGEKLIAIVHMVNMDFVSLVEPVISGSGDDVTWDSDMTINLASYEMVDMRGDQSERNSSPIGNILEKLMDDISQDDCAGEELSPLSANIQLLNDESCRSNFLKTIRGAEVFSGQRFTYREVWGILIQSIIGPTRSIFRSSKGSKSTTPQGWITEIIGGIETNDYSLLDSLLLLAEQRVNLALFNSRIQDYQLASPIRFECEPVSSTMNIFSRIDPVNNAVPEWAFPVNEAMMAISLREKPSDHLKNESRNFSAAWHSFDEALETELLRYISSDDTRDVERRNLTAWYGNYIYRLYGLVTGNFTGEAEVSEWVENWRRACKGHPLTPSLQKGLEVLLKPRSSIVDKLVLPIFSSRTEPIVSRFDGSSLVYVFDDRSLDLSLSYTGNYLLLEIRVSQFDNSVKLILDYPVIREAMTCVTGEPGFTEQGLESSPRMERLRASLLSSKNFHAKYCEVGIVKGSNFYPVSVV